MNKWDRRYLDVAKEVASWSKDPSSQVGSIAIGPSGEQLSNGFNGIPRGLKDTHDRLNTRELKYQYVVHSEQNLIYNACRTGTSLMGSTVYVYGLPVCPECAKGLIQVGVSRVVMQHGEITNPKWEEDHTLTESMFLEANIEFSRYVL